MMIYHFREDIMILICEQCEEPYGSENGSETLCQSCLDKKLSISERKPIDVLCDGLRALGLNKEQTAKAMALVRVYIRS